MSRNEQVARWSEWEQGDADVVAKKRSRIIRRPSPAGRRSRYGRFWQPTDLSGAMKVIFNGDDADLFERTGEEQANALGAMLPSADAVVVDIGCGIGRVARYMAPKCKLLWAVDVSERMLRMAASRLDEHTNVRYARCADTRIPDIEDGSVDFVYAILVLQHLEREDAFLMLREIRRILRPGGSAFLTFPNLLSDVYLQSFIAYAESGEAAWNPVRARVYTPDEVQRLLPAAGLAVTELEADVELKVRAERPMEDLAV